MKILSPFAGGAVALVVALTLATSAHADPLKCKREIAKDFAKYVQAKTKTLQKCRESIAKGKFAGPCPDAKAADKIAKADSKTRVGIAKKCGGNDKTCSTTGDGNESPASLGFPPTCPNFEGGACNNPINDCDGISDCLLCVGEAAVDQAIGLSYDDLVTAEFGTNSPLNKCQIAIGKNAGKFLGAKNKALQKCEDGVLKGTVTGPCPDAVKALPAINKAESKKVAGICKACGGADKQCDGNNDLAPVDIGFPATCPSVTIPGGAACGGAVTTLSDLVDCIDCVNEFKADCLDPIAVPSLKPYPSECNPSTGLPCAATPTNAPTPCPTSTPGIVCPSQVVTEANGPAVDLDTGWTGQSHDAHAPSDNRLTLTVSGCSNPDSSTCGVCTTSGPIDNAGGVAFNNHRCALDTRFPCSVDPDCVGPGLPGGTCSYFFGGPLPLSAGGVSVCVTNQVTAPITGTVDIEAGSTANTIQLLSRVYTGPTLDKPCPNCVANVCDSGVHVGQSCTPNGTSDLFGAVSYDCPPLPGANAGNLPITLAYSTGTQTQTLTAANPACRATGYTGLKCFCDTCNNLAQTPCMSNADCVGVGATICGGRRCLGGANDGNPCTFTSECPGGGCGIPGRTTAPNECDDAICSSTSTCVGGCNAFLNCTGNFICVGGANLDALCTVDSECPGGTCDAQCPGGTCVAGNEGTCAAGPFELFCGIETFRGCTVNADCPRPGDACTLGKNRDCFLDNGALGGSVTVSGVPYPSCGGSGSGVVGALFCVPPTASGSVNAVSGLPGLGRITLPYTVTFN